ncbi:hypothetical protein Droror1_Dr00017811 [Drosera rotundifolia]
MAEGNVLEPEGMIKIKFRSKEMLAYMNRLDQRLLTLKQKLVATVGNLLVPGFQGITKISWIQKLQSRHGGLKHSRWFHVPAFVESIWFALRDPVLDVQKSAAEALWACIYVIERGVPVEEMKLYGGIGSDEPIDQSFCEDWFEDLEAVISQMESAGLGNELG